MTETCAYTFTGVTGMEWHCVLPAHDDDEVLSPAAAEQLEEHPRSRLNMRLLNGGMPVSDRHYMKPVRRPTWDS